MFQDSRGFSTAFFFGGGGGDDLLDFFFPISVRHVPTFQWILLGWDLSMDSPADSWPATKWNDINRFANEQSERQGERLM